jgi:glycosyltransferase involved in cell wall biosynthesis
MNTNPKISIITIAYNAEKYIERTLISVTNQTYPNIEYIIIDGASKDSTLNIVSRYKSKISIVVTEPDKGLYDAMNKGIEKATGDYINFMNAGDEFYSNKTLSQVFINSNMEDFIYGDTIIVDEFDQSVSAYHKVKPKASDISYKSFINGMVVCHQSMIIKKTCVEKYNFSQFKLACDIEWSISSIRNCLTFRDTEVVIAKFLGGGISQNNRLKSVKERFWISVKHFGWIRTIFYNIKMVFSFVLNTIYKRF